MSSFNDIANWAINDILHRPQTDVDLMNVARNAAQYVYLMVCAKVPFDELQTTSPAFNLVNGQTTYSIGTDLVFNPPLRAIQNVRISFGTNNARRLRRSHVRVYDALAFTTSGQPSTYARWDTQLILNPAPNSSAYTWQFRYWFRPVIGLLYNITAASWAANVATYTVGTHSVSVGDLINVSGVSPAGYNVYQAAVTAVTSTTVSLAMTINPGVYTLGGLLEDLAPTNGNALWYNQPLVTPREWDELLRWETLYRVYYALNQPDVAASLMTQRFMQQQPVASRKQRMYEPGIIPRLWNDLLETVSQKENVDEDFNINPLIRAYSLR